jgi:hypothetical protein
VDRTGRGGRNTAVNRAALAVLMVVGALLIIVLMVPMIGRP